MNTKDKLIYIQKNRDLNDDQLAKVLSVHVVTIKEWLKGTTEPSENKIREINSLFAETSNIDENTVDVLDEHVSSSFDFSNNRKIKYRSNLKNKTVVLIWSLVSVYLLHVFTQLPILFNDTNKITLEAVIFYQYNFENLQFGLFIMLPILSAITVILAIFNAFTNNKRIMLFYQGFRVIEAVFYTILFIFISTKGLSVIFLIMLVIVLINAILPFTFKRFHYDEKDYITNEE